jgi:hypothetical protein
MRTHRGLRAAEATRCSCLPKAIKSTTERIFVIRVSNGVAEWVDVRRGAPEGDLVEVFGNLKPGDRILDRPTDEVRNGSKIASQ